MIENLKVFNFKGVEKAEIKCRKVTLFVGENRQGKTSMLTAIGWCIAGGNKPYFVRNGTNETRIVADTERAVFDRVLVRGSKKDRISITKKSDGSTVDAAVALSNFSDHCFDPIKFIFLDPKIQTKIIREALSNKMSLSEQEASDMGIVLFEQDGSRVTTDAKTLCENAYKRYFEERTEINRQVDAMKKKMASAKLDFIPDQAFILTLERQVKELEEKLNEQIKKNARIKAAQGNAVTQQKLQDQFNQLEAEIKIAEENLTDPEMDLEKCLNDIRKRFTKDSAEEAELRGSYNMLKKTLDALEAGPFPICPISMKIACNTDMTDAKEGMKTELFELSEKLKTLHKGNLELSERLDALTLQLKTEKALASKIIERDRTKAMLDNLSVCNEAPENDELTKTTLNEKQQELSTAKIAKELGSLGDIEEKIKRQRHLDDLVKKLRNFIDVELTKRAKLEVSSIEVKDDGIYFKDIPLSEESTSVQLRASCAIMKNLYPKNKLILTDRLEILDRKILLQFLRSYLEGNDGMQLFGTYVGDFDFLKNIPNLQLIEMKAGIPVEV
jgi:predicted ATPase